MGLEEFKLVKEFEDGNDWVMQFETSIENVNKLKKLYGENFEEVISKYLEGILKDKDKLEKFIEFCKEND